MSSGKIVGLICSVLLPPLGAVIAKASLGHIVLNVILTIFGFWILGVLHAAYLVTTSEDLE